MNQIDRFLVSPDNSIREVMACIDTNSKGIALLVDEEHHLMGTLTDGDIRRAILAGLDLSSPVAELLKRKAQNVPHQAVSAALGTSQSDLLRLMIQHSVRHIPLLDENARVLDLATFEDMVSAKTLPLTAVIMAGGYGKRLHPLTDETPKPMLPVQGRPIIEWIVERLRDAGISRMIVTTHYKAEAITRHLGDGSGFGAQIEYVHEDKLSGTAGALALLPAWQQPILVMNADILTHVDFRAMLNFHQELRAVMTLAVREYHLEVPYGIVEMEDTAVRRLSEKPSLRFFVNAGIYILEPLVQRYIPRGEFADMTDVITRLLHDHHPLIGFPVREYWIDVGQHADYERAQDDMQTGRDSQ